MSTHTAMLAAVAHLLDQRVRRLRQPDVRRWQRALSFGPHHEPWYFMPSHLRLSELASIAASLASAARATAPMLGGWVRGVQLDLDIWQAAFTAWLPAGAASGTHQHRGAAALLVLSGQLQVVYSAGTVTVRAGQHIGVLPGADHQISATVDSQVLEVYSPRVPQPPCHALANSRRAAQPAAKATGQPVPR